MKKILHEPLLHFAVTALCIFGLYEWLARPDVQENDKVINVTRPALLEFIQYRTRAFHEDSAEQRLQSLTPAALEAVINDYVREEALYRAAVSYGLDQNDYVIKRRMVQKVDFMAQGVAEADGAPDEASLTTYYQTHLEDFTEPATITFTHIFVRGHGEENQARAQQILAQVDAQKVPFEQATRYGERFVYQTNYVERPKSEIADHFGTDMASDLFAMKPDAGQWRGVLQSKHGYHLVLLTDAKPLEQLDFSAAREQVTKDYKAHTSHVRQQAFVRSILADFEVEIAPELVGRSQ